ncbi:hypothetical protein [Corynebacterium sp.]|uniref:hypothetical protein n=1 Tax=Corynebacterium sp. TaxID=1720 RepID=UPI0026E036B2|nr:hypothetical protein [Corynebacterium sp.]MDO5511446.1 hypothetical protein [Corynebacterium sp.]
MTSLLLRLHRTLWKRSMAGNSASMIMAVLLALYAFIGLVSLTMSVWMLDAPDRAWGMAGMVGMGVIAYIAVAVVIPSGESQLNAADFATLPVTERDLHPAMAWSTLLTTRGAIAAVTTVLATGVAVWLSGWWWILVMPVVLLMTLLLGELARILSSGGGRVSSERMNILSGVLVIVMIFGFNVLISYGLDSIPLDRIGRILAWTPAAAPAGLLASLIDAAWLPAAAQLAITVLTVVLGVWWWRRVIGRRLDAPADSVTHEDTEERKEGVLLPGLPYTPGAMIYSRGLRYFRRDPRMIGSVVTFPIIAAVLLVQGATGEEPMLYVGMILIALLSGSLASNDFGYDGPAMWSTIVAGVPARTLLLGRHLAQMTPMVVLVVLFSIASIILADNTGRAVLVGIVACGMLITVAGLALLLSTHNPFPTAKPGTSPWADKSGFSGAAFVAAFGSLLLGWIPAAPGAVMIAVGWVVPGVLLVLAVPAAFYWVCLRLAEKRVRARLPEIYGRVSRWVN